jgi:hypothetical protein
MTRVPLDRRHRSWVSMDREHHGWVGALFGDGAISIGLGPVRVEPVPVGLQLGFDADGTDMEDLGICRDGAEATGWIGVCICGWRSRPWTRVVTQAEEDVGARRVYDGFLLSGGRLFNVNNRVVSKATYAEWVQHLRPDRPLADIADLTGQRLWLEERLAAAVVEARWAGATWEDIGHAAAMTRQSAHERWSAVVLAAAPPVHGSDRP